MKEGKTIAQITDGTSNTILAVEAEEGVPWAKPDDFAYDAKKPLPTFAKFAEHNDSEPGGAHLAIRPSIEAGTKYEDLTTAYIRELHAVLTRKKMPSAAVADLEKELVAITGFRTGAPER